MKGFENGRLTRVSCVCPFVALGAWPDHDDGHGRVQRLQARHLDTWHQSRPSTPLLALRLSHSGTGPLR